MTYFNSIMHVLFVLNFKQRMEQWQATSTSLYIGQASPLLILKRILYCGCSNKFNLVSDFKSNLAKHNNMFCSTEQQDCQEAFNNICDILDKVTHVPLYFNDTNTSRIEEKFIGIMSTKASCTNFDVTYYGYTEYKEIYIQLHHYIEEHFSEFTRLQFCIRCNNNAVHNCHNNFVTYPNILTLVVRRFDNYMHKLTSKLNGGTLLIINDHNY